MAKKLGSAVVYISAKTDGLNKALGKAERTARQKVGNITKTLGGIGRKMTLMGGAVVGATGLMVKNWASAGDAVHKMALRTGIGTEALSELKYAAEISGSSLEGFETGIRKMQRSITEAGEEAKKGGASIRDKLMDKIAKAERLLPKYSRELAVATTKMYEMRASGKASNSALMAQASKMQSLREKISGTNIDLKQWQEEVKTASSESGTYTEALSMLGLNFDELKEKSPEEQFGLITEKLAGVDDKTRQAAIAQELFGRSGTALLPMLSEGTQGLKDLREAAHENAVIFDQEAADAAAELTDRMTDLKGGLAKVGAEIATAIVPALLEFLPKAKSMALITAAWIKENKGLVTGVVALGGAMAVGGPLLIGLGMTINAVMTLSGVIVGLGGLIPALGLLVPAILALGGLAALAETFYKVASGANEASNFISRFVDSIGPLGRWIDKYFDKFVALTTKKDGDINWWKIAAGAANPMSLIGGAAVGAVTGHASGGMVSSDYQIVGEQGPELVSLPKGSQVFTAQETQQIFSGNGGGAKNINITVNANTNANPREIATEINRQLRFAQ